MWLRLFSVVVLAGLLVACAAGDRKPTVSQVDSDGDGVIDGLDRCPDSAPGSPVDSSGCGIDSDLDGVFDHLDRCPGTVLNVPVDIQGCPLDSDGDGVTDDLDRCADTPAGELVDIRGCTRQVIKPAPKVAPKPAVKAVKKPPVQQLPQLELMVHFRTGKAELLPGNEAEFDRGAAFIKQYPGSRIVLEGHTDSVGPSGYNQTLSEKRAGQVAGELKARLPTAPKMTIRGYGESKPVATNDTQAGREKNRRVVILIEGKK